MTIISNFLNNQKLTDAQHYKIFHSRCLQELIYLKKVLVLSWVTTKLSLLNEKILEVPISYVGRTYEQGKKINYLDGFRAIKTH